VSTPRRGWVGLLELAALGIVVAAVGWALYDALQRLDPSRLRWPVARLVGWSLAGLCLAALFAWLLVRIDFRGLGQRLGLAEELALGFLPRLGKYVPGRIHSVLGLVWLARRLRSAPVAVSGAAGLLQLPQGVGISLVAGAALAPFTGLPAGVTLLLCAGGLLGLGLLHPSVGLLPVQLVLRWLHRPPLEARLGYRDALLLGAWCVPLVLAKGLVFGFLVYELLPLPPGLHAHLGLSFVLGVLSGFLVFFAPAGLGVQEGAMLLLLAPALPPEQAAVVTLAGRLWNTVLDVLLGLLGGLALTRVGRRPPDGAA
jgi:hypothetical protein